MGIMDIGGLIGHRLAVGYMFGDFHNMGSKKDACGLNWELGNTVWAPHGHADWV